MESDTILLPVSLGEAIDKLTILDIKLASIKDSRINDVRIEYDLLYDKIQHYIEKYKMLYTSMKKINSLIWDLMDSLRDGALDEQKYLIMCKKTIDYNDIRFRIKNKINTISGSLLKEQKGYKINSVLISIDNNIRNLDDFILPIRYYSFLYDRVFIKLGNYDRIKENFKDDETILCFTKVEHTYSHNKQFSFLNKEYTKEEIFKIFDIDEQLINSIL